MERCRAVLPFEHQSTTLLDANSFRGMASVFNHLIDAYVPTRIKPGAFAKTLKENAKRIKVLYQHNPDWPIGVPTRLEETADGLLIEAKVSQTERGKEALTLIRDGVITELSIGFDPIRHEMVNEGGIGHVRHVSEVRLWEISPVTFAANSEARITDVNARTRSARLVDARLRELEAAMSIARRFDVRDVELSLLDAQIRRG
jgi:uncharacterized protein